MYRLLHCYAEGRPQGWEAICLDLDVSVQGKNLEDVVHKLSEAIDVYVETVSELPEEDQRRLMRRSAPLSLRLKFLWHAIRTLFDSHDKPRAEFTCHCPA